MCVPAPKQQRQRSANDCNLSTKTYFFFLLVLLSPLHAYALFYALIELHSNTGQSSRTNRPSYPSPPPPQQDSCATASLVYVCVCVDYCAATLTLALPQRKFFGLLRQQQQCQLSKKVNNSGEVWHTDSAHSHSHSLRCSLSVAFGRSLLLFSQRAHRLVEI